MYWLPRKTGNNPLFEVHAISNLKDKLPYSLGKGHFRPKNNYQVRPTKKGHPSRSTPDHIEYDQN